MKEVKKLKSERIWEIDLLRAIAIILMAIFHFVYDLKEFAGFNINYEAGLWFIIGKISAVLFILISAISSNFSRNSFKRGIKVFFYGMLITVVTYLLFKDLYIRFGILHFLGITMMLFPLLKKLNTYVLISFSIISFVLGTIFSKLYFTTALFLPLGIQYKGFSTLDYYPVFPYIGITFFGIIIYRVFYSRNRSLFPDLRINSNPITFISKNALGIYLIHQPIFILLIVIAQKIL